MNNVDRTCIGAMFAITILLGCNIRQAIGRIESQQRRDIQHHLRDIMLRQQPLPPSPLGMPRNYD